MSLPDFRTRPPARILVVSTLRIGDALLTTPLVRSLKRAFPQAAIDMVVLKGCEGVLAGNPDLAEVIAVPLRDSRAGKLAFARRLWRRYDLAVSPVASDRARLYCWLAARWRAGFLNPVAKDRAKGLLLTDWQYTDDLGTHAVEMGLRLADRVGAPRCGEVVLPTAGGALPAGVTAPFAVLHPYPKFNYKMWTEAGWIGLAKALQARGLQVLLTGSPDPEERATCARVAEATGAASLAGTLSLAQTADLLRAAALFVGPDTAVTHLAAAAGVPTVALFGPSHPVKWGPWPKDWRGSAQAGSPWPEVGSGRQGNVYLLQGEGDCVPCRLEGCDRHVNSFSRCLQELPLARVLAAIEVLLGPAGQAVPVRILP